VQSSSVASLSDTMLVAATAAAAALHGLAVQRTPAAPAAVAVPRVAARRAPRPVALFGSRPQQQLPDDQRVRPPPLQWTAADGAASSAAATLSASEWLELAGLQGRPDLADGARVPGEALEGLTRATCYLEGHSLVVQRAVQLAAAAHAGQARKNGEPFIVHPVETSTILAGLKMDLDTIVAGLLHDTVEDTDLTLRDIARCFGPSVTSIVEGDTKRSKLGVTAAALDEETKRSLNHRAMLVAMGEDWRIVVVKLADRLHNMRTLRHMPRHKQVRIARETTQIFVPLAQKLGIEALEYELLRLSVQFLFPQQLLRVPYGLELLGHWARLQCWGLGQSLDDYLCRDQVLSELDLPLKLDSHRQTWLQHSRQWDASASAASASSI